LQHYLNIKHSVIVSSGTAALHLSLMALDIRRGDEVIVPAFTYPATANVVELVGAKPVLVDISLDDFCINISRIEEAITQSTKVIIPVHEFGQSADIENIVVIAQKYNLDIVEDDACALGSEYKNKKVGTFGKLGCFSFHPRKAITTGECGVIITNDNTLSEKIRALRNHGIAACDNGHDFIYAGCNYRMTDFQAALGLSQLSEIEEINQARIKIAEFYDEKLSKINWIKTPSRLENRKPVYQTYHILVNDELNRDELIHSFKHNGIETNLGAQALNCLSFYQSKYKYKENDFPYAAKAYKQGLALPVGMHLKKKDISQIVKNLQNYKSHY